MIYSKRGTSWPQRSRRVDRYLPIIPVWTLLVHTSPRKFAFVASRSQRLLGNRGSFRQKERERALVSPNLALSANEEIYIKRRTDTVPQKGGLRFNGSVSLSRPRISSPCSLSAWRRNNASRYYKSSVMLTHVMPASMIASNWRDKFADAFRARTFPSFARNGTND